MISLLPPIALAALLLITATADPSQRIGCPKVINSNNEVQLIGRDPVRAFTEISGLVFSKKHVMPTTGDPIVYAITDGHNNNDINGRGRVGAFNSRTGQRLVTLVLSNATGENWDWESLTLGTCGPQFTPDDNCIYVGDVGDNVALNSNGRRNDRLKTWPYRIIKIREPDLTKILAEDINIDVMDVPDSDIWILPFDYSHPSSPKPVADSEAIFLDHGGWGDGNEIGDIYVLPKWGSSNLFQNRLFIIPVSAWNQAPSTNPWAGDYWSSQTGNYIMEEEEETVVSKQNLRIRTSRQQSTTSFSINIPQSQPTSQTDPSSSSTIAPNDRLPENGPETPPASARPPPTSVGGVSFDLTSRPMDSSGVTFLPVYSPEAVGDYPGTSRFLQYQWTGADMALDGTVISLSTYEGIVFFLRCPGESVAQAITGFSDPCSVLPNPLARNGIETSAWTPDGTQYLQIPEGRRPRMGWVDIDRRDVGNETAKECPSHPHFDNLWWNW